MSRKDTFHDIVRQALEKDNWSITHDPLLLRYELRHSSQLSWFEIL
ncbi:MAG: element excision factor XisH family protein [Cyanobacteria bacterium J06634_6]